jgi:hypothetical protein
MLFIGVSLNQTKLIKMKGGNMRFRFFSDMDVDWTIEPGANNIIGFDVFDRNNNDVGEIVDLLVDGDNNDIARYALVDKGWIESVFGIKRIVVPVRKMLIDTSTKSAHLDISREELRKFPDYALDESGAEQIIDSFWGNESYRASAQEQKELERPQAETQAETTAFAKEREPVSREAKVIDKIDIQQKASARQKETGTQAHEEISDTKEHGPEGRAA